MDPFDVLLEIVDKLLKLQDTRVSPAEGIVGELAFGQRMQDECRNVLTAIEDVSVHSFPILESYEHKLLLRELERELQTANPAHLTLKESRDQARKALGIGRDDLIAQRNRAFGLPPWEGHAIQSIVSTANVARTIPNPQTRLTADLPSGARSEFLPASNDFTAVDLTAPTDSAPLKKRKSLWPAAVKILFLTSIVEIAIYYLYPIAYDRLKRGIFPDHPEAMIAAMVTVGIALPGLLLTLAKYRRDHEV